MAAGRQPNDTMGNPNDNSTEPNSGDAAPESLDFIREIIANDLSSGKHASTVTRFPPEPNGYIHIGHAKSICLNFGVAQESDASVCHLRFDDTNPVKEDVEYVDSIKEDVAWLGFDWGKNLYFASDYFEKLYGYAVELIENGKAFVCDLTLDEIARWGRSDARRIAGHKSSEIEALLGYRGRDEMVHRDDLILVDNGEQ